MKLIRCSVLGAALVFSALSTVRSSTGTCKVLCVGSPTSNPDSVTVYVQTSYEQCCVYEVNPCPSGYYPNKRFYDGTRCPNPI